MDATNRQDYLMNRPRQPAERAAVFLENRLIGERAPVFVDSYNQWEMVDEAVRQQGISEELWCQANNEKDQLFELMERVRHILDKKVPSSERATRVDLRHCTWQDVMQEVQSLSSNRSSGQRRSTIMEYLDRVGRNSAAFESWLQLLPGGDYGSSICGVFSLTFGAIGHYSKVEDAILDGLAQIPEIIETTRRYIKIYSQSRDHRLEQCTFDLYLSILKALSHIMHFFTDSSLKKVYQPLIQQSSYKSALLESLEDIKSQAARIKEEANQCMQRRLMDIDQSIRIHTDILQDTNEKSDLLLDFAQNIYRLLLSSTIIQPSGHEFSDEEMASNPKAISNAPAGRNNQNPGEEKPLNDSIVSQRDSRRRAHNLLQVLDFDPNVVSLEIETCIRLGYAAGEVSKARTVKAMQHSKFASFISQSPVSGRLLVNGNGDMAAADGISPLSVLAARLASIIRSQSGFAVTYFCGQHRPYSTSDRVPLITRLMSSLVGQLTSQLLHSQVSLDTSFLDEHRYKYLENVKLKTLCKIFESLTDQIPKGTMLVCILDEVSLYETGAFQKDIKDVVRRLARLSEKCDNIAFKLLVTCRGRSRDCSEYFPNHVLEMDESVEADDSSTWHIENMSIG